MHYRKYKALNRDEQRELCERRDAGDDAAAWKLAESVFPYAHRLAAQFCKRRGWDDFDSAYAAACLGAHRAASKLDPSVSSITTYAHRWILQFLHVEFRKLTCGVIWVPPFSPAVSEEDAERAYAVKSTNWRGVGAEDAPDDRQWNHPADPAAEPSQLVADAELHEHNAQRIHATLARLDERSAEILRRRFMHGETLQTIGEDWNISRGRVRQIAEKAAKKFRHLFFTTTVNLDQESKAMSEPESRPSAMAIVDQLTPELLQAEMEALESAYQKQVEAYKYRKAKLTRLLKAIGCPLPRKSQAKSRQRQSQPREGTFGRKIYDLMAAKGPIMASDLALSLGCDVQKVSGNLSQGKGRYWTNEDGKWSVLENDAA